MNGEGVWTAEAPASADGADEVRRLRAQLQAEREYFARSHELTAALSCARTRAQVARVAFERGLIVFGADAGALALVDPAAPGEVELIDHFGYPPTLIEGWRRFPLALRSPSTDAIRGGEAVWVESPEEAMARYPEWGAAVAALRDRAWAALPLRVDDRTFGALGLSYHAARTFSPGYRDLIRSVAERCAQALDRAQAHDLAARHAAELEAILDTVPIPVFLTRDPEARTVRANRAGGALLGVPADTNVAIDGSPPGPGYRALHDGAVIPRERSVMYRAAHHGEATEGFELDLVRGDGRVLHLVANAQPVVDAAGTRLGAVGAVVDVTERHRAAEALRESEQRFRIMADGVPVLIWATDAGGGVEFVNRQYCAFFGVSLDEVRGKGWQVLVHPDDAARYVTAFQEALARRVSFQAQGRVRRADGRWRWIESYASPRFSPAGEFLGMAGASPDITEEKEAVEALRAARARLGDILRHASAGTWEVAGGEVIWSPENHELLGVPPGTPDLLAAFRARVVPEDLAIIDADFRAVEEGRVRELRSEFRIQHPVRGLRWILGVGHVTGAAGTPELRLHGLNLDITDRKRAELAVQEADRRKTEFLAVLSHELRNPLAALRNALHLLSRVERGSEGEARARLVLHRQAEQLSRLVDDLLDVSRINQGKIVLQLERHDARDLVRRVIDDLRALFDARGVVLALAEAPAPAWVDVDAARFGQMVGNLVHNALKFTPAGGRVDVALATVAGRCRVRVRDTGVGIAPEELASIFDRFAQADRTRRRAQGGMGIGLAVVRELAQRHGGDVAAASPGPGRGAEFVLELPLAPGPPPPRPAPRPLLATRSLEVLVVEDNLDAGETLAELLRLAGHAVRTASSGRQGLESATSAPPDVLLCDLGLPDMTGLEVIQQLRARAGGRGPFAVALTGYAQAQDRRDALAAGFDAHLAKPPDLEALLRLVDDAAHRGDAPPA